MFNMKNFYALFAIILQSVAIMLVIAFIPGLPPNMEFKSFSISFQPLTGKLAVNDKLDNAEKLFENELKGPEDFAIYKNELYTSAHGGYVHKISEKGDLLPVVKFGKPCDGIWQEHICGRPLGLKINPDGIMIVADAYYGIQKFNLTSGDITTLVGMSQKIDGFRPGTPNSVAWSKKELIYWTDSSTAHKLHDGLITLLGNGNGRVVVYDSKTKENTVLIKDLYFPNGLALADDESYLLIAETLRARVLKHYLTGPKAGETVVFVDSLPGFPDNLSKDKNGNIYVSLIRPPDSIIKFLAPQPFARKLIARTLTLGQNILKTIHETLWGHVVFEKLIHWLGHFEMLNLPFDKPRVSILIVNSDGIIIDSMHSTDGKIAHICSIAELNGYYYLGSPYNHYLARVKINK